MSSTAKTVAVQTQQGKKRKVTMDSGNWNMDQLQAGLSSEVTTTKPQATSVPRPGLSQQVIHKQVGATRFVFGLKNRLKIMAAYPDATKITVIVKVSKEQTENIITLLSTAVCEIHGAPSSWDSEERESFFSRTVKDDQLRLIVRKGNFTRGPREGQPRVAITDKKDQPLSTEALTRSTEILAAARVEVWHDEQSATSSFKKGGGRPTVKLIVTHIQITKKAPAAREETMSSILASLS